MLVVINDENDPNSAWEIWDEDNLIGCAYGDTGESQDEVVARAKAYAEAENMLQLLEDISRYWPISGYEGDGMMTVNIKGASYRELQRIINTLKSAPTIVENNPESPSTP